MKQASRDHIDVEMSLVERDLLFLRGLHQRVDACLAAKNYPQALRLLREAGRIQREAVTRLERLQSFLLAVAYEDETPE